ncbi:MAG: TolC family protein [bacterium]|nr:TolC family protein [bacterium]
MKFKVHFRFILILICVGFLFGCASPGKQRKDIDQTVERIIQQKQLEALGKQEPFTIENPEDALRRILLQDQNLPYSDPSSLGTQNLDPIPHWPKDDYLKATETITRVSDLPFDLNKLKLEDVLQIAAKNSRQYQSQKEAVYRSALRLDLARDQFRNTFSGMMDGTLSANLNGDETVSGIETSTIGGLSRRFMNGMTLTTRIGLDLVRMLNPIDDSSRALFADASISIPLLRGSGKHIVAEPLTQAERDAVYAIYNFERYKKTFAVNIASNYLYTLQQIDRIDNAINNYNGLITSTRWMRRMGDAGKQDPVAVDQSIQQELSARNGWISAQIGYERQLDSFKVQLGIAPDSQVDLDREELKRLTQSTTTILEKSSATEVEVNVPPADAPIELAPPSRENIGPFEIKEAEALRLAFENRLDLRVAQGEVYDAQRKVVVAADALRAELSLLGSTNVGEGRSLGSSTQPNNYDLNFQKGRYNALLSLDLPLERTAEIASYRESIIALESAVRALQELEDSIKLDVRNRLRELQEARESLVIQAQAVRLADRRVKGANLSLQAGRVTIRDLLESQRDLLASQNSLTSAMVNYRVAELDLQLDLGVLEVNEIGLWKEFSPEGEKQ